MMSSLMRKKGGLHRIVNQILIRSRETSCLLRMPAVTRYGGMVREVHPLYFSFLLSCAAVGTVLNVKCGVGFISV